MGRLSPLVWFALVAAGVSVVWAGNDRPVATPLVDPWLAPKRWAGRPNPLPSDPKAIADGRACYAQQCAACHGQAGLGDGSDGRDLDPPPTDLTCASVAAESDGALYWKITTGRSPMPAFRRELPDEQRWHLVSFIRTLGKHDDTGGGR